MKPINIISSAIQRERKRAGISLSELAKRANISKSTLSQLESRHGNPSIETLWAIANTLNISVSKLIDQQKSHVQLIRAGNGTNVASSQSNYLASLLSASPPGARRDIYALHVQPDEPKISSPHHGGTIEHLILMSGSAIVGPVGSTETLMPGDYISYPADVSHIFQALEANTQAVLIIECT